MFWIVLGVNLRIHRLGLILCNLRYYRVKIILIIFLEYLAKK